MDTKKSAGEPSSPAACSAIRRAMIADGMSSEHAAIACGYMADYAMTAYKDGYGRGFNDGHEWALRKPRRVKMGMAFDFKVGDRVHWTDPDRDNPCDGAGTIVSINTEEGYPIDEETIISVDKDDGGCVEVLPHEIDKAPSCRVSEAKEA